ncbi:MAG: PrsW family intramembrane metalloprotease [Lachnospiraceae bacterium]|nr:PrsW family intramembrane metalloprotease [Lachnospiraceae bacterium]
MFILAILPGIVLFVLVWRFDKTEKEPPKLLWKIFLFGALTTITTCIIGSAGDKLIAFMDPEGIPYKLIENFIMVALIEESGKFFVLKKITWNHPAFDYTFDAVVYAVTSSLGFAVVENIVYLLDGDLSTAILRAVLSVPGHVIYGVFMGCFYGMAKVEDTRGNKDIAKGYLIRALVFPAAIHGFYDFCLDSDIAILYIVLLVFEVVLTVKGFKKLKELANNDTAINPVEEVTHLAQG